MDMDNECIYAGHALPTPTDTPYRTPRNMSRRSSRHGASSPLPSSSPPPLPPSNGYFSRELETTRQEGDMPVLDHRRFTPTLQASLVSEILSLRRDLESKNGTIENLESNLQTAKANYDGLNEILSSNSKETRSLKRQMQLLEGGTASALGELAKERDEALDSLSEFRRRLEVSQKKVRNQEDEKDRACSMREKEKEVWDGERRNLERRVHTAEGRLKSLLEELASQQASAQARQSNQSTHSEDAQNEISVKPENDTASIRSLTFKDMRPMSAMSNNSDTQSLRFTALSGSNSHGSVKVIGLSLADELNLEEEDEEQLPEEDHQDRDTPSAQKHSATPAQEEPLRHQRNWSESLMDDTEPSVSTAHTQLICNALALKKDIRIIKVEKKAPYIDAGVQFSPPPSPRKLASVADVGKVERLDDRPASFLDNEANQRRKRVSAGPSTGLFQSRQSVTVCPPAMVSASSQTVEFPPSPPRRSRSTDRAPRSRNSPLIIDSVKCTSTQTDAIEAPSMPVRPPPPIPAIEIHPPMTMLELPNSDTSIRTRSVACQTLVHTSPIMRSVCMQTEGIRIDNRPIRLPPHLLPSSISSDPPTPKSKKERFPVEQRRQPTKSSRSPKRSFQDHASADPPSSPPVFHSRLEEASPGNNKNGPLGQDINLEVRRPFRISSLFAGFDSSQVGNAETEGPEQKDSRYRAAFSTFKPSTKLSWDGKQLHKAPSPVPELNEPKESPQPLSLDAVKSNGVFSVQHISALSNAQPSLGSRNASRKKQGARSIEKPSKPVITNATQTSQRAALISTGGGTSTQQSAMNDFAGSGAADPTQPNGPKPPFPVPTRSSSRRIPMSASDGAQSPVPRRGTDIALGHWRKNSGRSPIRKNNIRKVRSAANVPRNGYTYRQRSQSPPPTVSSVAPDSPQLPPLPRDVFNSTRYERNVLGSKHSRQLSASTNGTGDRSVGTSAKKLNFMDAIAQTMVGEWMWKYVRRRTSFGVPESGQPTRERGKSGEDNSGKGIRHKRWVCLAPYERAVVWSSKQPVSGSALLGKSGRKLSIISVLDVKDDTPVPKAAGNMPVFDRSILILTPARALKFTATTKERHDIWLTALSFLSQSAQGGGIHNDLGGSFLIRPQESQSSFGQAAAAPQLNNLIRDSIRVAKGKPRPIADRTGIHPLMNDSTRRGPAKGSERSHPPEKVSFDVAEPPSIPRFSTRGHGRKRSSTGPRIPPPPSASRSFSYDPDAISVGYRGMTSNTISSELNGFSTLGGLGLQDTNNARSLSMGTSDLSGEPSGTLVNNLLDPVGTVRMEAFVARPPSVLVEQPDMVPRPPRARVGKKDMSYWGASGIAVDSFRGDRRAGIVVDEEFLGHGDPFAGF